MRKMAIDNRTGLNTESTRHWEAEWYRVAIDDVERELGTSSTSGLSEATAQRRLAEHGPNEVHGRAGPSRWRILIRQLTGVMTLVLFAAAAISLILGDTLDAVVILAIVVLNAALGYTQE